MKKTFLLTLFMSLFCSLATIAAETKGVIPVIPQIQCSDGRVLKISLSTRQYFVEKDTVLKTLANKAEKYYQLINLGERGVIASTRRCDNGVETECTAVKIKTTELDYIVGLRRKIHQEFVAIQKEVAIRTNLLCTENVPTLTNIRQSN